MKRGPKNRGMVAAIALLLLALASAPAAACERSCDSVLPPGSSPVTLDANDERQPTPERDDGCPQGCSDCFLPCCHSPVLGFVTPAAGLEPVTGVFPAVPAIEPRWASAPARALDHPPRA